LKNNIKSNGARNKAGREEGKKGENKDHEENG
jgi:hypothetical protein